MVIWGKHYGTSCGTTIIKVKVPATCTGILINMSKNIFCLIDE